MTEQNKFKVIIDGKAYTLVSDEPELILKNAVAQLNELFSESKKKYGNCDSQQVAVLISLQLINKTIALQSNISILENHHKSIIDSIDAEL